MLTVWSEWFSFFLRKFPNLEFVQLPMLYYLMISVLWSISGNSVTLFSILWCCCWHHSDWYIVIIIFTTTIFFIYASKFIFTKMLWLKSTVLNDSSINIPTVKSLSYSFISLAHILLGLLYFCLFTILSPFLCNSLLYLFVKRVIWVGGGEKRREHDWTQLCLHVVKVKMCNDHKLERSNVIDHWSLIASLKVWFGATEL